MENVDITVIGAGVIGLAVSRALSGAGKEVVVVEKNPSFGQEASSRNSEVIHAGLYYPGNSLKSIMCIRGKELLYELCSKHNIPSRKLGKLLVACDKEGLLEIDRIYKNASDCGIKNLRFLNKKEIKKLEPCVEAESAIFSPGTGIVDSHALMEFFYHTAKDGGVDFAFSVEATAIKKEKSGYEIVVREPKGELFTFRTKAVINCAGLDSDTVAGLVGMDPEKYGYSIRYCKGRYFRVRNAKKFSINHLVYPPPTKTDLGIHVTPDLAGELRLGPDAEYTKEVNYDIDEKDKKVFLDSVSKFLPSLEEEDLMADTAGVRAKLQGEGEGFRDFVIKNEEEKGFPDFVNLIGIESPGLTGSLAIAEVALSCLNIQ